MINKYVCIGLQETKCVCVCVCVCFVADDVDDLMSLLDAGMHADHPGVIIDSDAMFGENMFGYSALRGRAMRSRVGTFTVDRF